MYYTHNTRLRKFKPTVSKVGHSIR